jgi:hypothetical protein
MLSVAQRTRLAVAFRDFSTGGRPLNAPRKIAFGRCDACFVTDERLIWDGKSRWGEAVGRCVYCGSNGENGVLSDEHIVAFSLGADTVLPQASCKACAKITSYLEGYAGREIYGPLRVHYEIQSRRKKIQLKDVPVEFETASGVQTRLIPRANLPAFLVLPILPPAGRFFGREPRPIASGDPWVWYELDYKEQMKRFQQPGDVRWRLPLRWNSYPFARMLAKIAHTVAIARLGIDSFEPFLPPFILGNDPKLGSYLIGGADGPTETEQLPKGRFRALFHHIEFCAMDAPGMPRILVAKIRLFSFTGSPSYYAIVGEPGPSAMAQLTVNALELQSRSLNDAV